MPGAILKDSSSALVNTVPLSLSSLPVRRVQHTQGPCLPLPTLPHSRVPPCSATQQVPHKFLSLQHLTTPAASINLSLFLGSLLCSERLQPGVWPKTKTKTKKPQANKQTKTADGLHTAEGDLKRGGKGAGTQEMNS